MLAIFEFLIFVFFVPYVLLAVLLAKVIEAVAQSFHPGAVMFAGWLLIVGAWLSTHMAYDPNRPWVSMIELFSQSHLFGIPAPFLFIGAAFPVLILSFTVKTFKGPGVR